MGTIYTIVNDTKQEIYGFGLPNKWHPKSREAILNRTPARFLLFVMFQNRGDKIRIISDDNAFDWQHECLEFYSYTDKEEETYTQFSEWDKEENEIQK